MNDEKNKIKNTLMPVTKYILDHAPDDIKDNYKKHLDMTYECLVYSEKRVLLARLITAAIGILYLIKCMS